MKTKSRILFALVGLFVGAIVAEQLFLAHLQYSVIHDNARLRAFLKSHHYPILVEPGFGFCRVRGTSWGYTYQLCLSSRGNPPGCTFGSLTLEYLGPQGRLSVIPKDYHDRETPFRIAILNIDRDGNICSRTELGN